MARVAVVAAGLAALVAGLFVGATGCCDPEPIAGGTYEIVTSEYRPELVGAVVEVGEDVVAISYTDLDGNAWVVSYAITDRSP
jgi:hypothetical protein